MLFRSRFDLGFQVAAAHADDHLHRVFHRALDAAADQPCRHGDQADAGRGGGADRPCGAARAQGIDPRRNPEGMQRLIATAREELESSIKGLIGPAGFSALQSYDATLPQRGVVNELQQRLGTGGEPLSSSQADQLVRILEKNPVSKPRTASAVATSADNADPMFRAPDLGPVLAGLVGGGSGPAIAASIFAPMPGGGTLISNEALVEAQPLLSAAQLAALQQLQRQQQAQQEVQRVVRESLSTANRSAPPTPAAPPPKR